MQVIISDTYEGFGEVKNALESSKLPNIFCELPLGVGK